MHVPGSFQTRTLTRTAFDNWMSPSKLYLKYYRPDFQRLYLELGKRRVSTTKDATT
jgi:hypothetical protein